jgi:hypothetical protein
MPAKNPPRFVPTLTEVVRARPAAPAQAGPSGAGEPVFLEEQIVQRVLQRIDTSLERKLREAIATVVLEHTRSLGPVLREQIEDVVRDAVAKALADEIASQQALSRKT